MSETFGQHIRALRKERGLTQRALSQIVGFRSLAHLSDIESGKRYPAKKSLGKFAEALGVTVADLESRDTRGPVEAAKALFVRRPEMVGAFLKVLAAVQEMDAEELVARVAGPSGSSKVPAAKPDPVQVRKLEPAAVPPAETLEPEPEVSGFKQEAPQETNVPDVPEKRDPPVHVLPPPPASPAAAEVAEAKKPTVRRAPAEKAENPAQPTLF